MVFSQGTKGVYMKDLNNKKVPFTKKAGDAIERIGEKIGGKVGKKVYDSGNKLEHKKDRKIP